jgi:hypothetical protein
MTKRMLPEQIRNLPVVVKAYQHFGTEPLYIETPEATSRTRRARRIVRASKNGLLNYGVDASTSSHSQGS